YALAGLGVAPLDVWDITDPAAPQVLGGYAQDASAVRWADAAPRRYVVAARSQRGTAAATWAPDQPDLRSPYNGADYLAITYNPAGSTSWGDALGPLVARRTAQGLRPRVIDVQWIYDQFGDGRVDPAAIRAFLAYAYANWLAPAPSYVLLVGDGTYDPHDYEGNTGNGFAPNYIPPYLAYVDPWLGETAADNRYVTLAGNDALPEMHLGRFPAASLADVTTMVNKTIAFEQADPEAAWLDRMVLVADDPDGAGDFHQISDDLRSILPPTVVTATHYFKTGDNVGTFRANLSASLNSGALFVNYIGHSGIDVWADPALYTQPMITGLSNGAMLPIMLPMTCYAGYYHTSFGSALSEVELRHPGGGAVASWSPTGLGIATGHDYLNRGLLTAVYSGGARRLGPATLKGKLALNAQGLLAPDLLDTYLIIGDPALQIPLPFTPITAVADSVQVGQNTAGTLIDPRANDLDPYNNGLAIVAAGAPLHGSVSLNRAGTGLTYTPQRRYVGPDTFTYTVLNPANGSRSSATISITVLATGSDLFIPHIRR
ncbi:MAG TPA: C25 family cysteine peptidase, partial [Herpetosiphonaceae bacterium]|nr:C25 family cysteine peptidase [Herpetosiphonaceae bacterium]